MTDKEQNKSEVEQAPTPKDDSTGMNLRGKDRRRFIKRAIVAAPFILTVTSRPVWAANCTLSGQMSGNLSDPDGTCGGEGCSADYWEGNTGMWHYEFQRGCVFDNVFGTTVFRGSTLFQVISRTTGQSLKKELGREAVAALQNAATRVSYDYVVCDLIYDVKTAFDNGYKGTIVELKNVLRDLNNQGNCPF